MRPDKEDVAHLIAGNAPDGDLRHYDVPVDLETLREVEQSYRANLRAYTGDIDAVYDADFLYAVERQEPLALRNVPDDPPYDEGFVRDMEQGTPPPDHVDEVRNELLDYVDRMRDPPPHPLLTHETTRDTLCNYIQDMAERGQDDPETDRWRW